MSLAKMKDGISVVIPTYNRKDLLQKTLDSLVRQTIDKSLFEVIVVDDGSADESDLLVRSFQGSLPIRYFFQEDKGFRVARARNIGIDNAGFSVVLFFDSGMIASSRLLQSHYDRQKISAQLIILGLSFGVNEYGNSCSEEIERLVDENPIDDAFEIMMSMPELRDCRSECLGGINFNMDCLRFPWVLFWTGHVSVQTAELRKVGGFDEWFNSWGGEDVELGLRLFQAGCRFEVLPGIESLHYPHFKDPIAKQRDSRRNVQYIHQKHRLESTRLLTIMSWEQLVALTN